MRSVWFAILLLSVCAAAQTVQPSHWYNRTAKSRLTPDLLARQLTSGKITEREKVSSIFNWITENIAYNVKSRRTAARNTQTTYLPEEDDDTGALKPLSERVAIDVLNRQVAFCDGYARLFKTLCDYAGIRSEVISGFADPGGARRKGRFGCNHRWNAVMIDSAWYLLDATWASGYLTYGSGEFMRHYNDRYFLTPPELFIQDHYPEDLQWTLLPHPPDPGEFRFSPFKSGAFSRKSISAYFPAGGIIEAEPGDTLRFEVQSDFPEKQMVVIDSVYIDSAVITQAFASASLPPSYVNGSKVGCIYVVSSNSPGWLHVVLGDEMILRYRLLLRSRQAVRN